MRRATGVDVRWWPSSRDSDACLAEHLRSLGFTGVTTGRLCPSCGSSQHGRPWARALSATGDTPGSRQVAVSLSRSGPHLLTAVRVGSSQLGVDVESVAEVVRGLSRELVCSPDELARGTAGDDAWVWVAKEAILKWLGTGLATPMSAVRVADFEVVELDAPPGYRAAGCTGKAGSSGS